MGIALIIAIVIFAIVLKIAAGVLRLIFGAIGIIIIIGILIAMFSGDGGTVHAALPAAFSSAFL